MKRKTIRITQEAYRELETRKKINESFSDVIIRLLDEDNKRLNKNIISL